MKLPDGVISSFVNVGGRRTHYIEAGNGTPVIMIHGGGPGASGWWAWREAIPVLAKHFHVYALDTLGFGQTDIPTDIVYADQHSVNHIAGFIDALCLDKVCLVGNSRGAYMAAKYMCDFPSRVHALLMVSSGSIAAAMGIERSPDQMAGLKAFEAYDGTAEGMRKWMEFIVSDHSKISAEMLADRVASAAQPGHAYALKSALEYRRSLRTNPNERQLYNLEHRLPLMTIPMHMIWGATDNFAPTDFAERLKAKLPNVSFEMFENSGHQAQNDESDRFNNVAIQFFKKVVGEQ